MKIYNYKEKANVIGPMIRNARKKQKLSQESLAIKLQLEDVELTQKAISRIEKQERFVTDFELLALLKILKLDPAQLTSLVDTRDTI